MMPLPLATLSTPPYCPAMDGDKFFKRRLRTPPSVCSMSILGMRILLTHSAHVMNDTRTKRRRAFLEISACDITSILVIRELAISKEHSCLGILVSNAHLPRESRLDVNARQTRD
ncbi:unnamed protein product [Colias eurytheme]|nr:unnamed protein product [Colias eurytheme]